MEQAEYFLSIAEPQPGDVLPALDLEEADGASASEVVDGMSAWLDTVEEAIGCPPMIYTSQSFWQSIGNPSGFSQYPLWVANYTTAPRPKMPEGWDRYLLWQYSQSTEVYGINGYVDGDRTRPLKGGLTKLLIPE